MHLEHIRCTEIRVDPRRVRAETGDFDALVESIRQHGVLRPVLVRDTPEGYMIVHGECRWRAAQKAGLRTIPALIVCDFPDGLAAAVPAPSSLEFAAADD